MDHLEDFMLRLTFSATAVAVFGALLLAGTANSLTTRVVEPATSLAGQTSAPAVEINVFELMGRALGELPVDQAD